MRANSCPVEDTRIVNSPFGELCPVSTQLEISHTRVVREKSAYG
jgi:hypothetical protein